MPQTPKQKRAAAFPLGERRLALADIVAVGRHEAPVELSREPGIRRRIARSRERVAAALARGEVIYAVNTGVGSNAVFRLPDDAIERFQESNLLQLACGTGSPLPGEIVRASMLLRAATLSLGYSAVRVNVVEALLRLLNAGITPVVPRYGSVGASGDLIPSAYAALALLGHGRVTYRRRVIPARRALNEAGISPLRLSYKEGIALINGTTVMTGTAALVVHDAGVLLRAFLAAAALCVEALGAAAEPYDEWVQKVKGHGGQILVGRYLRRLLESSAAVGSTADLRQRAAGEKPGSRAPHSIQSGYSVRCLPQGIGPMRESIESARAMVEIEANSANDNPLVDPASGRIYHTGSFYGGHVARAMDGLKIDLANLANWTHALMAVLVDDRFSGGLPPALVAAPGLNTGFKGMQLSLASLTCAVRQMAAPSSVHPVSTEQHNQDIVSLGLHAALTARDALECARNAVAILLLSACQAVDLRGAARHLGQGTRPVYTAVRVMSKFVKTDRALEGDVAAVSQSILAQKLPLPEW